MMICKADFEELLPHVFKPESVTVSRQVAKPPSAECVARWEDDGGRSLPATRYGRAASCSQKKHGQNLPLHAKARTISARLPVAAAYAAAWTMLSAYGQMTTGQHAKF